MSHSWWCCTMHVINVSCCTRIEFIILVGHFDTLTWFHGPVILQNTSNATLMDFHHFWNIWLDMKMTPKKLKVIVTYISWPSDFAWYEKHYSTDCYYSWYDLNVDDLIILEGYCGLHHLVLWFCIISIMYKTHGSNIRPSWSPLFSILISFEFVICPADK